MICVHEKAITNVSCNKSLLAHLKMNEYHFVPTHFEHIVMILYLTYQFSRQFIFSSARKNNYGHQLCSWKWCESYFGKLRACHIGSFTLQNTHSIAFIWKLHSKNSRRSMSICCNQSDSLNLTKIMHRNGTTEGTI